ncbi:EEF1A lysine methyltransferase 2-like [Macrobrachium nipponense]|uniref:EEF1A lysine methyltransferase 2-like n=1 Tax=Macrobrachium nipponense TaxID=159736 RepID=UPI0030C8718B
MSDDEELTASELGTKEYWDSAYERELSNFENNGDVGDIWFGEESMDRVLKWMLNAEKVTEESSVLDVGCGNGVFLIHLANEGFTKLFGIDYSAKAIDLAKAIALDKDVSAVYEQVDLVAGNKTEGLLNRTYDVVHDKGTYDAVSLNPEDPANKRLAYIKGVHCLIDDSGLFIITSCNWTKEELEKQFQNYFIVDHVIPTPSFMFGGKVGSQVTCLVFRKVKN